MSEEQTPINEERLPVSEGQTEPADKPNAFKTYLKNLPKRYFITAFSGMSLGLFATLIAGTILEMFAKWIGTENIAGRILIAFATSAKFLMGAGIGIGIAYKLEAKPLVVFTAAVTGFVGAFALNIIGGTFGADVFGKPGNPIGAYVVSLFTIEIASLYAGKTKFDIIFIPLGMILMCFAGIYVAYPFIKLIDLFAELLVITINAGAAVKVITGILISVVMGVLLTMPTSSAAIWIAIATSETAKLPENTAVFAIAGGAAVAGCAAHMVGFAVSSYRENGFSGLISQGLGTSMLQIPNIMKKPVIMLPEIIASVFAGLVAVLLDMRCTPSGGGMGTSGLVGVFGTIDANAAAGIPGVKTAISIVLCMFIIPAAISLLSSELLRKKGVIAFGDMKLPE